MGTSSTSPYFRLRFSPKNSSSGVEQALDRLRPLLRFRFSSHELGRPSQRQVRRRSDEKGYAIPSARVVDIEVEIESLPREMSASIQQYQVVDMGSPQRSPRLEVVSRVDCNAVTLQDASTHLASALVGVDEENSLVIENRAAKWWWLVHPALPRRARIGEGNTWPDSPPGRYGSQGERKSPDSVGALGVFRCVWATARGWHPIRRSQFCFLSPSDYKAADTTGAQKGRSNSVPMPAQMTGSVSLIMRNGHHPRLRSTVAGLVFCSDDNCVASSI